MKKIVKLSLALSVGLFANSSSGTGTWDTDNTAIINTSLNNTYIFNKKNYLLKNQDHYEIESTIRNRIYNSPNLCKAVNIKPTNFIYIYPDGVVAIVVDGCK